MHRKYSMDGHLLLHLLPTGHSSNLLKEIRFALRKHVVKRVQHCLDGGDCWLQLDGGGDGIGGGNNGGGAICVYERCC